MSILGDASFSAVRELKVTISTPERFMIVPKTYRHVIFSLKRHKEAIKAYKQFTFKIAEHKLRFRLLRNAS